MMQRFRTALVVLAMGAGVIAAALVFSQRAGVAELFPGVRGLASVPLDSAHGPVRLADFRGRVLLVYFGYTHCPDVCPMALGVIAAAMKRLTPEEGERVAALFVSVDPRRDTPAHLAGYVRFFDSRITGATADAATLAQLAGAFRADFVVPEHPGGEDYPVEHSTFIYLLNRHGRVVGLFDERTRPELLADEIRRWL